jgi:hypothetical protein
MIGGVVLLSWGLLMLVLAVDGRALSQARARRYERQVAARGTLPYTLAKAQRMHRWFWGVIGVLFVIFGVQLLV